MRLILSLVLATVLMAGAYSSAAFASSAQDAEKFVSTMGNKALAVIANTGLDKAKRQAQLEKLFSDSVDTNWVGKFVMGRFWNQATDEQKKNYLKEYNRFLVTHYAGRFAEYSGGSFKITGSQDNGDDEFLVNLEITTGEAGEEPVLVDYRVRDDKGFTIYDIVIEGVSMIQTQRSEFSSLLNNKGIDYLIEQLANKRVAPPAVEKKS